MIGIRTSRPCQIFSDDEDEAQEEFRPGPRTGSDRVGPIEEDSSLCD